MAEEAKVLRLSGDEVEAKLGDDQGGWILRGKVRLTHGTMTLQADRMTANRENRKFVSVEAEGDPVAFAQTEPTNVSARAAVMIYDVNAQTLELVGDVELLHEGNQVRGDRITYDLRKGELVARAAEGGGKQIEFVLEDLE